MPSREFIHMRILVMDKIVRALSKKNHIFLYMIMISLYGFHLKIWSYIMDLHLQYIHQIGAIWKVIPKILLICMLYR